MIDHEAFCGLRQLRDQQGFLIAAQLDLDPKTVANWIERATYQHRQGKRRASKLDCFQAQTRQPVLRLDGASMDRC